MADSSAKAIVTSKTFWFNVVVASYAFIKAFFKDQDIPDDTDGQVVLWLMLASGLINVILRTYTSRPVKIMGMLLLVSLLGTQTASADILLIVNANKEAYTFDTVTKETKPIKFDVLYVDGNVAPQPPPPNPNPNPNPDPDPDPDPPVADKIEKEIGELSAKVEDPIGAYIFAGIFNMLSIQVEKGVIPADADKIDTSLTTALDEAFSQYPGSAANKSKWAKVSDTVVALLGREVISSGGNLSKKEWAELFMSVSNGYAVGSEGAELPNFVETLLRALLNIILQQILTKIGG